MWRSTVTAVRLVSIKRGIARFESGEGRKDSRRVPNVEHLEVVLNVEETSTQVIKFGAQGIVKIEEATEKATGLLTISNSVCG
jgi:hypothetical protein